MKARLIEVYSDTWERCKKFNNKYRSVTYYDVHPEITLGPEQKCNITVRNQDVLDVAKSLIDTYGTKPLVLNLASEYKPGGGVEKGSMAQEEEIFRRTSAHIAHDPEDYPLGNYGCLYCPNVAIIKDSKYKLLNQSEDISILTLPAIRKPKLASGKYNVRDKKLMEYKLEMIFLISILYKHDTLVLGALGCGVFENPPEEVALIFKSMIDKYKSQFKHISFAILSHGNNYEIFKKIMNA